MHRIFVRGVNKQKWTKVAEEYCWAITQPWVHSRSCQSISPVPDSGLLYRTWTSMWRYDSIRYDSVVVSNGTSHTADNTTTTCSRRSDTIRYDDDSVVKTSTQMSDMRHWKRRDLGEGGVYSVICGPGSSVGIATGYGLDGPGIESWWGWDFPHLSKPGLGPTQTPVQLVPGISWG